MRALLVTIVLMGCVKAPKHANGTNATVDVERVASDTAGSTGSGEDSAGPGEPPSDTGPATRPDTAAEQGGELRGIWVTRWTYSSVSDVQTIMSEVAAAGFNTVFFQVRGRHDAFYDSDHEPWAKELTGTLGQNPGWDPLATAVEVGHENGLAVHAYINVFPFWSGETAPTESTLRHPYLENPEWLVADAEGTPMALNESYVFASPGNPDVREHLAKVALDITTKYAVDGVHLDYIRYPGNGYSHDLMSLSRWESAGSLDWAGWQRQQVNETVAAVSSAVSVPITAAVWGIYENTFGWSGVSQGNIDYYQDSRAMLADGLLDATIPMIYWPVAEVMGEHLDFRTLVRDHVTHASGRHVYAGISAKPEIGLEGVVRCIEAARAEGAHGVVVFDYSQAREWMPALRSSVFAEDALPPTMSWR